MVLAVALFGIMDAIVKRLTSGYGIAQIAFFRSSFALVPIALMLMARRSLTPLRTSRPWSHVVRSLVGAASVFAFYYGYSAMPLTDAYALGFTAPLFLTALSHPLLGERVGWRRWCAVGVGFLGVLVMLRPGGSSGLHLASFVCLGGAVAYALALAFTRKLGRTETNTAIVFYFMATTAAVAAVAMPGAWVTPGPGDLALLAATGIIGGVAQLLVAEAFRQAPAAIVAPFDYTAMIWAALYGYLLFGDVPTAATLIGVVIVSGSGLYILYRETRLAALPA